MKLMYVNKEHNIVVQPTKVMHNSANKDAVYFNMTIGEITVNNVCYDVFANSITFHSMTVSDKLRSVITEYVQAYYLESEIIRMSRISRMLDNGGYRYERSIQCGSISVRAIVRFGNKVSFEVSGYDKEITAEELIKMGVDPRFVVDQYRGISDGTLWLTIDQSPKGKPKYYEQKLYGILSEMKADGYKLMLDIAEFGKASLNIANSDVKSVDDDDIDYTKQVVLSPDNVLLNVGYVEYFNTNFESLVAEPKYD